MRKNQNSFFYDITEDLKQLTLASKTSPGFKGILWILGGTDAYWILFLHRLRTVCKRNHIPILGRVCRIVLLAAFGIEISANAKIGHGVYFVHSVGVVIGGTSVVGARTLFLGSNTLGTVDCEKYPSVGCDVVIGAGARLLDGVQVGDGCMIGANAVVTKDVPSNSVAVGIPARAIPKKSN